MKRSRLRKLRRPLEGWLAAVGAVVVALATLLSSIHVHAVDPTACYVDPAEQCYDKVGDRGRNLDGIHNPQKFKPFGGLAGELDLVQTWHTNPGYLLAELSHAAYLPEAEVEALIALLGGQMKHFDHIGRQAYLFSWPGLGILVFRGTQSSEFQDVLDDIKVVPVPFRGATVHRGFMEATATLWAAFDLWRLLEETASQAEDFTMVATGHSLGAAMAVIASMMHPFDALVTFGQPLVGTQLDAAIPEETLYLRVVNGADNVTTVPPTVLGYGHYGELVAIEDRSGPAPPVGITLINADHSIVNYAEILRQDPDLFPHILPQANINN